MFEKRFKIYGVICFITAILDLLTHTGNAFIAWMTGIVLFELDRKEDKKENDAS